MSLLIEQLAPGDRVILNCPKCNLTHREAEFLGLYASFKAVTQAFEYLAMETNYTRTFINESRDCSFAVFQTGALGPSCTLIMAMRVDPDGRMTEEEGRRVIIERRAQRPAMG